MNSSIGDQRLLHWLLGALALAVLVGLWMVTDFYIAEIRALLG